MANNRAAALPDDGLYRLLIESISDYAIYMLDAAGVVVSWNPGAQRFKGYRADEILGAHFSQFYTEEDRASGLPVRALATAAGEGRFENEGWRVRKDGGRFWAHVIIDPIVSQDGALLGYAKVTRDLTERKKTQEALRESEERFRYLVQGVTDYAIYMLDTDGRITNWNSGAQKIKGYAPEEVIGAHFSKFFTEADRQNGLPQRGLETARATGRFESEGIRVRKDGTHFWATVAIDAIYNDDGVLIGFAKVTRDITERRAAEQALTRASEELLQSQKMEAIGRLTGGVAHDFNNLLMAISGSLELLRKRLPNDEWLLRLVDNAMQGTQRGASLTQRMLAFARRQELKPQPTDLEVLVRGMADLLSRSLGPSIEIDMDFPNRLPPAMVDENQLELAVLNLAVNARDAMPNGGTLMLSTHAADGAESGTLRPGSYTCLTISDNGTGMDASTLARATEPFFTTKGVGKGTGLGLAMVRGLAEQSGGALGIESGAGKGTSVTMCLPVAKLTDVPAGSEDDDMVEPAPARPSRILVVDDDFLVAMNTTAMLEDLGHKVVEAHSGKQALELLASEPDFDLMITDQAMPQMTGSQLVDAARAIKPGLPIILATGYAELPDDADRSLPTLRKPFFQADLERILAQTVR